jgi:hypothetical protein
MDAYLEDVRRTLLDSVYDLPLAASRTGSDND